MTALPRDLWFGTSGPRDAPIVLVGESWGREEEAAQRPFVGASGQELTRMLSDAGINRDDLFLTNVIAARPEANETWRLFQRNEKGIVLHRGLAATPFILSELVRLRQQIEEIRPQLVIAAGNYALWALTECCSISSIPTGDGATVRVPGGIMSWRGSMLETRSYCPFPLKILPIVHPAGVLREWYLRSPTVHDLRTRVPMALRNDWRPNPSPLVWAPPTFEQAKARLEFWLTRADNEPFLLSNDIETARGVTTCMGFADGLDFAMVIPFIRLTPERGFANYWPGAQDAILFHLIRRVLTHPNIRIVGQNYIYDMQYICKEFGVIPNLFFDTMLGHHLLFPGTPKGLDYLSSLYCKYHWYWKDDGKEWDVKGSLEQLLLYNAEDNLRTLECAMVLIALIEKAGMKELWLERLELNDLALEMMNRGVRIDTSKRGQLALELGIVAEQFEQWFESIIPQARVDEVVQMKSKKKASWWDSPTQQRQYFSHLGLKLPTNRKTGRETFGKEALTILSERHPEFIRMFEALRDYRSVGVFHNTFIKAPLDPDDRMRCSFNVAGTETFRWSSSENAFGRGTNLQNIPAGNED